MKNIIIIGMSFAIVFLALNLDSFSFETTSNFEARNYALGQLLTLGQ